MNEVEEEPMSSMSWLFLFSFKFDV
jgi:hypothetical protein